MKSKRRFYFANLLSACADEYQRTLDAKGREVRVSPARRKRIRKLEKYATRSMIGE